MELINNIVSNVYVVLGIFVALALFAVFFWAKGSMVEIETGGSSVAIAENVLSAPCINIADMKGAREKFMFDKAALDKYNNSEIDCVNFDGSFYFIEVRTDAEVWHFNNTKTYPYAYNALARGILKNCPPESVMDTAELFRDTFPIPYAFRSMAFSALLVDGETLVPAYVRAIIDADTGTDFYASGYPLCLCDVPCPYKSCTCSKKCLKSEEIVGFGAQCT